MRPEKNPSTPDGRSGCASLSDAQSEPRAGREKSPFRHGRNRESAPPPLADSGCASLSDAQGGDPHPLFFVSAESKGLRDRVNPLFATLAGRFISVAAKGLMGADCWRESNGLRWEDFGGVRRTSWRVPIGGGHGRSVPEQYRNYSISI